MFGHMPVLMRQRERTRVCMCEHARAQEKNSAQRMSGPMFYMCTYTWLHTCPSTSLCTCPYTSLCTCPSTCLHACPYTCLCTCLCTSLPTRFSTCARGPMALAKGRWPLRSLQLRMHRLRQAMCDMEHDGGGWTRVLACGPDSTWDTFAKDDALAARGLVNVRWNVR